MSKESYARGFCKAAEAAGVDPEVLAKFAQTNAIDSKERPGPTLRNYWLGIADRMKRNPPRDIDSAGWTALYMPGDTPVPTRQKRTDRIISSTKHISQFPPYAQK